MTPMSDEYMTSAIIGNGITICGVPPKKRLVTTGDSCWNCESVSTVRLFSGSGWYEDQEICLACGDDSYGNRPFKPRWRVDNIAKAKSWIAEYGLLSRDQFFEITGELIREEMDWTDDE